MIIDMHGHLGDILYPDGGKLIYQKNVKMQRIWDPQATNEAGLNRTYGIGKLLYKITGYWATKGERARNFTATLENFQRSLDETNTDLAVCLPIAPYVTFEDLAKAKEIEPRIIPFTSVDFTTKHDVDQKLAADVAGGAMGLKLHPIIQNVSLQDNRTKEALEAFERHGKPVLIHTGVSHYYLGEETHKNTPEFGKIESVAKLIKEFPRTNFIVGHSGLFWVNQVCDLLSKYENVWVETSFQSPRKIKQLVSTFGEDKVLYGSDWPYGSRGPHLKIMSIACKKNPNLEEKLLFKNARAILNLA